MGEKLLALRVKLTETDYMGTRCRWQRFSFFFFSFAWLVAIFFLLTIKFLPEKNFCSIYFPIKSDGENSNFCTIIRSLVP